MVLDVTDPLGMLSYIEAILDVCEEADYQDAVFWRGKGSRRRAFARCRDTFAWATADAEEIAPDDVPLFQECARDLLAIEAASTSETDDDYVATAYLPNLFAARKRALRPMRALYEGRHAVGPRLAALFDAVGPERIDPDGKKRTVYDQEATG